MSETIVVLTEESLNDGDAKNLLTLVGDEPTTLLVLIPDDRHKNVLAEFFHHLSLLEFSGAFRDLSQGQPSAQESRGSAEAALESSLRVAESHGLPARGFIASGNAVEALVEAVAEHGARQAVVITRPHAVADTLHTDWANQAQDRLGVPVLHLYSGSGFIGGS